MKKNVSNTMKSMSDNRIKSNVIGGVILFMVIASLNWFYTNVLTDLDLLNPQNKSIRFYPSDLEVNLSLNQENSIFQVRVIAISTNTDVDISNEAEIRSFELYDLRLDTLKVYENMELINLKIEDIEIKDLNRKYSFLIEIQTETFKELSYAGIINSDTKSKLGYLDIFVPYSIGSRRDSTIIRIPIVLSNI